MKSLRFVLLLCSILVFTIISCKKDIPGCTNPNAVNFDPNATESNGSCVIVGCTNPASENYNPEATVDNGTCIIKGCTNPASINYNPQATVDDGSCQIKGCTDPTSLTYNPAANVSAPDSCKYRKDLFLGTYKGSALCDNDILNQLLNNQEIVFTITEIPGEKNMVTVKFDIQLPILDSPIGTIDNNNVLTFLEERKGIELNQGGTTIVVDVKTRGTFTVDPLTSTMLNGRLEIEVKNSAFGVVLLSSECTVTAIKQ